MTREQEEMDQALADFKRDIDEVAGLVQQAYDRGWFFTAFAIWLMLSGWRIRYAIAVRVRGER